MHLLRQISYRNAFLMGHFKCFMHICFSIVFLELEKELGVFGTRLYISELG
jgi:hypothetical protein